MPRFNGAGPSGQGPMTGRGMGPCNPQGQGAGRGAGQGAGRGAGQGAGRGAGQGFFRGGAGRGGFFRGMFQRNDFSTPPVQDKTYLENEVAYLKEDLKAAQDRLKTMEDE